MSSRPPSPVPAPDTAPTRYRRRSFRSALLLLGLQLLLGLGSALPLLWGLGFLGSGGRAWPMNAVGVAAVALNGGLSLALLGGLVGHARVPRELAIHPDGTVEVVRAFTREAFPAEEVTSLHEGWTVKQDDDGDPVFACWLEIRRGDAALRVPGFPGIRAFAADLRARNPAADCSGDWDEAVAPFPIPPWCV
jgi:hypothetical protein